MGSATRRSEIDQSQRIRKYHVKWMIKGSFSLVDLRVFITGTEHLSLSLGFRSGFLDPVVG